MVGKGSTTKESKMTRNAAIFTLAHIATRRSVDAHGGDYRATFAAVLRIIRAELAADANGCVAILIDEAAYGPDFDATDHEFVACAVWAIEGDAHCMAA